MKIDTKYDIGDKVWYLDCNEVVCNDIRRIRVHAEIDCFIEYFMLHDDGESMIVRGEKKLFLSKQELIESL